MTGAGLGIVNEITATRKTFLLGGEGRRRRNSNDKKKERVRRAIKKAARGKDSSTVRGNIEKRDFRVTRTTGMSETKF